MPRGSKQRKGRETTHHETALEQTRATNSNVTSEQEEEEGRFGYDCQVILGCVHLTPNIVAAAGTRVTQEDGSGGDHRRSTMIDNQNGGSTTVVNATEGGASLVSSVLTPASGVSIATTRTTKTGGKGRTPTCDLVDEGVVTDVVNAIFTHKPFIVLESELDREGAMAQSLFKAMNLMTTKDQLRYWVDKDYRAVVRYKHMRQRNNAHTAIKKLMIGR